MPSIYQIKPAFQSLLRPVTRALANAGVTANQVTILACVLSLVMGACIARWPSARWPMAILPAFLFARMALNAIDGMLAREHGQKSSLGAILNELGDVVADAGLYLPFAWVPNFDATGVVLTVILSVISEMTGVVAVQIGASRRYDGPAGKSDRAFFFGLTALVTACGVPTQIWGAWGPWIMVVGVTLTIINRARCALAELRTRP